MPPPVRRWLIRFGYDGATYAGWARQPGRRTIEGTIREGLRRTGIAPSPEAARIEVASRTDQGVSARENALTLSSPLPAASLLRAANGIAPDLLFLSAAEVDIGFRVRRAEWREYRYFEATDRDALDVYRSAARRFVGHPIDVRSFGRGIPAATPTWRKVDSVEVHEVSGGAEIEVRAPSFVWGMVRKIVAALRAVATKRLPERDLERALRGELRLTLPLAEPENLLLWAVHHAIPPQVEARGLARRQQQYLRGARAGTWARSRLLRELGGGGALAEGTEANGPEIMGRAAPL